MLWYFETRPTVYHHVILVNGWIVNLDTLQVEVSRVFAVQHASSQIRNILACIALSGDVHLVALHAECLDKSLPEIIELV
jgi:ribosomal protein S4